MEALYKTDKSKLEEMGLAQNTLVLYTSDHGEMLGANRTKILAAYVASLSQ